MAPEYDELIFQPPEGDVASIRMPYIYHCTEVLLVSTGGWVALTEQTDAVECTTSLLIIQD